MQCESTQVKHSKPLYRSSYAEATLIFPYCISSFVQPLQDREETELKPFQLLSGVLAVERFNEPELMRCPFTLHFLGHHFAFPHSGSAAAEAAVQVHTDHLPPSTSPSCRTGGVGKQHDKQEEKTASVEGQPKCLGISISLDYFASEEK